MSAERVTQRTLGYQAFTATTSPVAPNKNLRAKLTALQPGVFVDADVCLWKESDPLWCDDLVTMKAISLEALLSFLFMMENETRG